MSLAVRDQNFDIPATTPNAICICLRCQFALVIDQGLVHNGCAVLAVKYSIWFVFESITEAQRLWVQPSTHRAKASSSQAP